MNDIQIDICFICFVARSQAIRLNEFIIFCFIKKIGTIRIIGGDEADIGDSPYNILCVEAGGDIANKFFGGSIISKNLILTAAHNIM